MFKDTASFINRKKKEQQQKKQLKNHKIKLHNYSTSFQWNTF